jgi:hypothetical protein
VGPGADLDRCGKSLPTGIRSPGLPARSESLYRLSYRGSPNREVNVDITDINTALTAPSFVKL